MQLIFQVDSHTADTTPCLVSVVTQPTLKFLNHLQIILRMWKWNNPGRHLPVVSVVVVAVVAPGGAMDHVDTVDVVGDVVGDLGVGVPATMPSARRATALTAVTVTAVAVALRSLRPARRVKMRAVAVVTVNRDCDIFRRSFA